MPLFASGRNHRKNSNITSRHSMFRYHTLMSINSCGCEIRNPRRCRAPSCRTHASTSRYSKERQGERGSLRHHVFGFDMDKTELWPRHIRETDLQLLYCSFRTDNTSKSNFGWTFSFPPPSWISLCSKCRDLEEYRNAILWNRSARHSVASPMT
jgi:hypothetical protein